MHPSWIIIWLLFTVAWFVVQSMRRGVDYPTLGVSAKDHRRLQKLNLWTFPILVPVCFVAAYRLGTYLFLCHLYGFSRVQTESLHFIQMPRGSPWVVSNGDRVPEHSLQFMMSGVLWIILYIATFSLIYWLMPKKDTTIRT